MPISLADEIDANEEARVFLETLGTVDAAAYNLRKLHEAVQHDVDVLSAIWQRVKDIKPEKDAKLARLKDLLSKDLKGKKILIFSYYRDTARYSIDILPPGKSAGGGVSQKAWRYQCPKDG